MDALLKISDISPVGTMAFLYEEDNLLVRVRNGWQYVSMGGFVPLPASTTSAPSTTAKPVLPSAKDNLIKVADGPMVRLVALNEPLSGDMGGIQRADYACFRQARQAGLRGTFRAFLASRVQNLDTIVRSSDREYPVVNLKGEVLFRSWNDIFQGEGGVFDNLQHDIYSFNNRNILNDIVWPQKIVWHGAGLNGERDMLSYCEAWTSSESKQLGVASSLINHRILAQEKFSCQNRFVVLCVEATSQKSKSTSASRRKRELDYEDSIDSEQLYQSYLHSHFYQ